MSNVHQRIENRYRKVVLEKNGNETMGFAGTNSFIHDILRYNHNGWHLAEKKHIENFTSNLKHYVDKFVKYALRQKLRYRQPLNPLFFTAQQINSEYKNLKNVNGSISMVETNIMNAENSSSKFVITLMPQTSQKSHRIQRREEKHASNARSMKFDHNQERTVVQMEPMMTNSTVFQKQRFELISDADSETIHESGINYNDYDYESADVEDIIEVSLLTYGSKEIIIRVPQIIENDEEPEIYIDYREGENSNQADEKELKYEMKEADNSSEKKGSKPILKKAQARKKQKTEVEYDNVKKANGYPKIQGIMAYVVMLAQSLIRLLFQTLQCDHLLVF